MPHLSAITKQSHADKSWARHSSYTFASKDNLASLAGAEIAKAVHAFPMTFIKQQDSFILVAVLSLTPGTNLFVASDGRWIGGYVPSVFRGHPFQLAKAKGKDEQVLCVDEDSGLVNEDKAAGEPFFDDTGEVSQPVKDILNFLNQVEQNRSATNAAVAALADAGVITEWPLRIKGQDQENPVAGLFRIDEAKLKALKDEQFIKLRKAGSLPIAYAQMFSMNQVSRLSELTEYHARQAQKQENPEPDINQLFGHQGVINFDNI